MPKLGDTPIMNENVINRFLLLKTHRASTNQLEISSFKHLFGRNFPLGSCPSQKTSFERGLGPPDCVRRKINETQKRYEYSIENNSLFN